jgi:hypothetical protein
MSRASYSGVPSAAGIAAKDEDKKEKKDKKKVCPHRHAKLTLSRNLL